VTTPSPHTVILNSCRRTATVRVRDHGSGSVPLLLVRTNRSWRDPTRSDGPSCDVGFFVWEPCWRVEVRKNWKAAVPRVSEPFELARAPEKKTFVSSVVAPTGFEPALPP
jgi:hypothetical protein